MSTITTTHSQYPSCPLIDPCGICRLLNNGKYEIQETDIDKEQVTLTLKKIKAKDGTLIYPITTNEQDMILQQCYRAVLSSCKRGADGGDELTIIESYDGTNGKITLKRGAFGSNPVRHTGSITLNFGVVTADLVNDILDILCKVYANFCGSYPPFATTTISGIGKASYIDVDQQGRAPIFVTTADPRWQILVTAAGLNNENSGASNLAELMNFLAETTSCGGDEDTTTNKDLLISIVTSLCGRVPCLIEVLDVFCGVAEKVNVGNNAVGVNLKDRYFSAEYGLKPLVLSQLKRIGAITPGQTFSYILPAVSTDGELLIEDLNGKGGVNGYVSTLAVHQFNTNLPMRGVIDFAGYLSAGYNQGLSYGEIVISQGETEIQKITFSPIDNTGQTRGLDYGKRDAPISVLDIDETSQKLNPGLYSITVNYVSLLAPNKTTDKETNVYAWSVKATFIPDVT